MLESSSPREEARRRREAGNAHYHRREYAVAIACYDRSVALDPSAHATYTNRAAARMASGDASGALDDADAAPSRATPGGSRAIIDAARAWWRSSDTTRRRARTARD